jgi:hypothetical protein
MNNLFTCRSESLHFVSLANSAHLFQFNSSNHSRRIQVLPWLTQQQVRLSMFCTSASFTPTALPRYSPLVKILHDSQFISRFPVISLFVPHCFLPLGSAASHLGHMRARLLAIATKLRLIHFPCFRLRAFLHHRPRKIWMCCIHSRIAFYAEL